MRKRFTGIIISLLSVLSTVAADGEYAVSKIPAELLKKANAVLRLEELNFEIINSGKAVFTNHYVITILNENGDFWAEFYEYYDKHRKIESLEGTLYDASGKQLKKIKTKDAEDLSGVSDGSLMDDNRYKRHNFYNRVYPYTIEYTVEVNYNSTLFFPRWVPMGKEMLSVEKSVVNIVCPADYQFRYKAFNYNGEPTRTQSKNNKTITSWAVSNMPAIEREIYSPLWHELTTVVIFGPGEFQVDDYKGNMASWLEFGKFVQSLKQGKDVLPDNIKQKVHQLTDGITDEKKKIAVLYEYLQKNTRYISIQLGIGGWQPFDAKYVATKSYGDCKALTNYMYSLLKEAGITSRYTLVRAGANAGYITSDFPSQQFNHVILSVPLAKDTVWLECTSQTLPSGYLSDFTCNRNALIIDETGGHMVRTPTYDLNDNLQVRNVKATLSEEGGLLLKASTKYAGLQQDDIHGLINNLSKDKVKEALHEQLDFATYDVKDFKYNENKSSMPTIDESLDIMVSNYATITGKRLFIVPNVMTRTKRKLAADVERKYEIQLGYEYKDIDSVEIEIPKGYEPESIPSDVKVESKFGKYSASVKLTGNKITYYRSYENYSGRFPAKDYGELVKFYDAIYKADRNRVVLVKNETPLKGF
jgi:transglutaminase-like putative cysteine protease